VSVDTSITISCDGSGCAASKTVFLEASRQEVRRIAKELGWFILDDLDLCHDCGIDYQDRFEDGGKR
jgi:hypothetical protein